MPAEPPCNFEGCDAQGVWLPVLLVRAEGEPADTKRIARADLSLPFCDVHRQTVDVDDIVGGPGFVQIVEGFKAAGRKAPDADMGLEWKALPRCSYRGHPPEIPCTDYAIEEIILTCKPDDLPKPIVAVMYVCRRHYEQTNRALIEQVLVSIQRLSYLPQAAG